MRILVLGASGQVGFELLRTLAPLGAVTGADRVANPELGIDIAFDLADHTAIAGQLDASAPDVIVNAAAHTAVDAAEDEPALADALNHRAVAAIAAWAAPRGRLVVHYSTDYVFPGDGDRPYREDDAVGPKSVYGQSKLGGEQALAASGAPYLLLRTAWVYGARGRNFLLTMLRAAAQRPELSVVDDQVGCPTTARFLAATTAALLVRWQATPPAGRAALCGPCHVVMDGQTSWCGFARAIIEGGVRHGLLEHAVPVHAIRTGEYPAKAPRPAYSVLDTSRLRSVHGLAPPAWQVGLEQTLAELAEHRRSLNQIAYEVKRC